MATECIDLSGEYYFTDIAQNCTMEKDKPVWFCDSSGCTSFIPDSKITIKQYGCEEITISYRDHFFNQDPETINRKKHYKITNLNNPTHYQAEFNQQHFSHSYKKNKKFFIGTEKAETSFKMGLKENGDLQIKWNNYYKGIGLAQAVFPIIFNSKNSGICVLDKI